MLSAANISLSLEGFLLIRRKSFLFLLLEGLIFVGHGVTGPVSIVFAPVEHLSSCWTLHCFCRYLGNFLTVK